MTETADGHWKVNGDEEVDESGAEIIQDVSLYHICNLDVVVTSMQAVSTHPVNVTACFQRSSVVIFIETQDYAEYLSPVWIIRQFHLSEAIERSVIIVCRVNAITDPCLKSFISQDL